MQLITIVHELIRTIARHFELSKLKLIKDDFSHDYRWKQT